MGNKNNIVKKTIPTNKHKAKRPQLVAPVNALDQKTTDTLYENQKIVVDHLTEFIGLALSIKKDMRKIIEEEVTKQFDAKKIMLEGLYKEVLLQKACLFDKKLISREDLTEKYEELRSKKDE